MADPMHLTITLRKQIADIAEGNTLAELVKQKLIDYPSIKITAQISNHINLDD